MLLLLLPWLASATTPPAADPRGTTLRALDVEHWPSRYEMTGTRSEPIYASRLRLRRDGDWFALSGGAPGGEAPARLTVHVAADGALTGRDASGRSIRCASSTRCALPLQGYLAAAAAISAWRRGAAPRIVAWTRFAGRVAACLDAAELAPPVDGERPTVDPCLDRATGAVLAFRHRRTGRFEGASPDPDSLQLRVESSP